MYGGESPVTHFLYLLFDVPQICHQSIRSLPSVVASSVSNPPTFYELMRILLLVDSVDIFLSSVSTETIFLIFEIAIFIQ
uniref:Uncharacterized protein n=1 Tax=Pyxicephalus adspersus TaxID=30357 RepID=A0AAV2ZIY5_PYXAD|nr:TPA: hypothetical protein GDO54_016057 [Pyxicephalus adspersus]